MNALKFIRKNVFQATQAEFAAIAGVTQATVSRWEDDEDSAMPTLDAMQAIRATAAERELSWDDRWFFEAPPTQQEAGAAA